MAEYFYDARGRRIRKEVSNSGANDGVTDFYYDGNRVVEERDENNVLTQQYVYGNYIDEVLVMDRNLDGDDSAIYVDDQRFHYHQDAQFSVYAVTDENGDSVESYLYSPYGEVTVFDENGDIVSDHPWGAANSLIDNPYLFTGRRFDEETGLYYYRARYYDADQGRFISRDPLGYVGIVTLYEYSSSSPLLRLDPSGLSSIFKWVLNIRDEDGLDLENYGRVSIASYIESYWLGKGDKCGVSPKNIVPTDNVPFTNVFMDITTQKVNCTMEEHGSGPGFLLYATISVIGGDEKYSEGSKITGGASANITNDAGASIQLQAAELTASQGRKLGFQAEYKWWWEKHVVPPVTKAQWTVGLKFCCGCTNRKNNKTVVNATEVEFEGPGRAMPITAISEKETRYNNGYIELMTQSHGFETKSGTIRDFDFRRVSTN